MSAKLFCCRFNSKRVEDSLASVFLIETSKKLQLTLVVWYLVFGF